MKRFISIALMALSSAAFAQQTITVSVSNPSTTARTDEPVVINLAPYGNVCSALITAEGQEIPCQLDDLDQNDTYDELCFLCKITN